MNRLRLVVNNSSSCTPSPGRSESRFFSNGQACMPDNPAPRPIARQLVGDQLNAVLGHRQITDPPLLEIMDHRREHPAVPATMKRATDRLEPNHPNRRARSNLGPVLRDLIAFPAYEPGNGVSAGHGCPPAVLLCVNNKLAVLAVRRLSSPEIGEEPFLPAGESGPGGGTAGDPSRSTSADGLSSRITRHLPRHLQ